MVTNFEMLSAHYVFKGRRFGQRRPPLTELIKSILERYPDGGQILKVNGRKVKKEKEETKEERSKEIKEGRKQRKRMKRSAVGNKE